MEIDRLAFLCCKGGWPEVCIGRKMSDRAALMVARSYVDAVCSSEMDTDDGVVRDSDRMKCSSDHMPEPSGEAVRKIGSTSKTGV